MEAAIALPIFMLFFAAFISIVNVMYIQLTLQIELEETTRYLSKSAYTALTFHSASQTASDDEGEDLTFLENIGTTAISIATIQTHFLDNNMISFLDNSTVHNGSKGVSFLATSVDPNENLVDVVLTYTVTIPFVPKEIASINLSNRCYMRLYAGEALLDEPLEESLYVYYTSYGRVLHINKYCRYLLNYSNAIPFKNVNLSLYQPCVLCVIDDYNTLKLQNPTVYTCEKGSAYHSSLDCSSFTGNIFRTPYSSLTDKEKICSECLKGK